MMAKSAMMAALRCALVCLAASAPTVAFPQQGDKWPEMDREEYGDWIVECFKDSTRPEDCQLYQRVTTNERDVVAMVVTFAWSPDKGAFETELALPLGVLLSSPPILSIGPDYSAQLGWSRCTSDGCLVEGTPSAKVIDLMKTSDTAAISVMHPTDGPIAIPVSLKGFSEALARITPK